MPATDVINFSSTPKSESRRRLADLPDRVVEGASKAAMAISSPAPGPVHRENGTPLQIAMNFARFFRDTAA